MKSLLLLCLAIASSSCMMNDTAKLKASKTCVIATSITGQADFHRLGITTFNNKHERDTVPGLKRATEEILRQELGRFYQIKAVVDVPDPAKGYDAAMAASRSTHRADLEICVYSYGYHPYGIPAHLESEGFGFYSGGSGTGTAVCYQGLIVRDGANGKTVASPLGENDLGIIPDADTFSKERYADRSAGKVPLIGSWAGGGYASLSSAQQQQIRKAFLDLYRAKVRNALWKMELR